MSSRLHIEVTTPIATVHVDGFDRLGAVDPGEWEAIGAAFEELSERYEVACVVVCGTGTGFLSNGPRVGWLGLEDDAERPAPVPAPGPAIRAIQRCTAPTVAIIEGVCVGAGLEIAASCDLRVCGESSRFGAALPRPEPGYDELDPLFRLLGSGGLLQRLRGGPLIGSERARRAGLVNRVHPDALVVEQGYGLAARVAAGAPLVNHWHKRFLHRLLDPTPVTEEARRVAYAALASSYGSGGSS